MFSRRQTVVAEPLCEEPFFADMAPEVVQRAEALVYHRKFDARQIIFFPEDERDSIYWVRTGRVKLVRSGGEDRAFSLRHVYAGGVIGLESLQGDGRWRCYGEAMQTTLVCIMQRNDFLRLADEEIDFCHAVATQLSEQLAHAEEVANQLVFLTVESRVIAALLRLYQDSGGESAIRVTHQELANLCGASRETTTTVLHRLRDQGLAKLGNRCVTLIDPDELQQALHQG
jgi:CRP/FNR family transcriptional regulator, cyclic AMP receptor protein